MKWRKKLILMIIVFICICVLIKLINPYVGVADKIASEFSRADRIALELDLVYLDLGLRDNETDRSINNDRLMMIKGKDIIKEHGRKTSRRFFYYTDYSNKITTDEQLIILAISSNPQSKSFGRPFRSEQDKIFLTPETINKIDFSKYEEIK